MRDQVKNGGESSRSRSHPYICKRLIILSLNYDEGQWGKWRREFHIWSCTHLPTSNLNCDEEQGQIWRREFQINGTEAH